MNSNRKNQKCPCGSGRKLRYCHGRKLNLPAPDRVCSIDIDSKNNNIIVVSKDMLINQLKRDGPKIAKSFDKILSKDIDEISELFSVSSSLLRRHFKPNDKSFKSTCAGLLSSSQTTFLASIEVARHGFRLPYGTLARQIIETLCTILDLATDEESLSKFHDGNLKSTKSVTKAKKLIPNIGEIYGMYSNEFTHISNTHSKLHPVSLYKESDSELGFILPSIKSNTWMIYIISELIFHNDISQPRYWKSDGNNGYNFAPSDEEIAWAERFLGTPTMKTETN
ncbi:SEC-C domain-containing protein [Thalassospira lucentensis]|uniref:SEC-C domain-containing protein n=1 Tax=Thalassospira lucentensis TaxID=168935 RepID=UPI003D2EC0DA